MRAAAAWLTARSTRVLRIVLAGSVGIAAALWQISPWRANTAIGQVIFWIAAGALILMLTELPIRFLLSRRAVQSLVPRRAILGGSYIDRIVDIGRSIMGDGHANSDTVRGRLARCPDGVQVLVRRTARRHVGDQVVGYLACWTISADAAARFISGEYRSGLDLHEDDFVVDAPGAAYITMLYGADTFARREMFRTVVARLRDIFADSTSASILLARPATHDGELVMRRAGMKPLHGDEDVVWSVGRDALRHELARFELSP